MPYTNGHNLMDGLRLRDDKRVPGLRDNARPSDMRVGHLQGNKIIWDKVVPANQTLIDAMKYNRGVIKF